MRPFGSIARLAGALCLGLAGVFASTHVQAEAVCDAAWQAQAEQRAAHGLELEQSFDAQSEVELWRMLMLGEGHPDRTGLMSDYHFQEGPFLPIDFKDDPEVTRILGLIDEGKLADAIQALEAQTHIPDPANTDIATERLLVRSELLFAGVLWTAHWDSGVGARALKWMALLDAHFLSLPLSVLNQDTVVNDAYWRAIPDLDWFLGFGGGWAGLEGRDAEDWWLPNTAAVLGTAAGVADATRESPLLDWLQSMEATRDLVSQPWVRYLSPRFTGADYANAYSHIIAVRDQSGALPWQIAVARRWAPAIESLGGPVIGAYPGLQDPLPDLERRAKECALTPAEQYALGPLRFHQTRYRALALQDPERGTFYWNGDIDPAEAATANDRTRQEIMRFALMTGQSAIAGAFQRARDPKASVDSYLLPELDALSASDLAGFAVANPDPSALNLLPVRILAQLIEMPGLRPDLRAAVARMAWTRAYVLDDTAILKRITPLVGQANAGLKPLLDAYQAAWTDAGRHHAALDLLLRTPGMQLVLPDDADVFRGVSRVRIRSDQPQDWQEAVFASDHQNPNDNNGWCRFDLDRQLTKLKSNFFDQPLGLYHDRYWRVPERTPLAASLQQKLSEYRDQVLHAHAILKEIDYEELGRLAQVPSASVYLAQAATEWARSSWWWDRYFQDGAMADALARSIQATRWGCHRDALNGAASNAAWRALHDMFPDSEAAKNSPYWYK